MVDFTCTRQIGPPFSTATSYRPDSPNGFNTPNPSPLARAIKQSSAHSPRSLHPVIHFELFFLFMSLDVLSFRAKRGTCFSPPHLRIERLFVSPDPFPIDFPPLSFRAKRGTRFPRSQPHYSSSRILSKGRPSHTQPEENFQILWKSRGETTGKGSASAVPIRQELKVGFSRWGNPQSRSDATRIAQSLP